jgi:hypothetical protein
MINLIFLITSILIVWFNTEAFIEYIQLFRIPLFKIKEYNIEKEKDCTIDYHLYLKLHHNNFFTRLITCPICTSFWLSLVGSILFSINLLNFGIIFICSLLLYFLFNKLL